MNVTMILIGSDCIVIVITVNLKRISQRIEQP